MTASPLLSYAEAAELLDPNGSLGITAWSIRRHVQAGLLESVRVGRTPAVRREQVLSLPERLAALRRPPMPAGWRPAARLAPAPPPTRFIETADPETGMSQRRRRTLETKRRLRELGISGHRGKR